MNATCVLITREKEYPEEILSILPEFDEILIETECPSVHRRYQLALKARNKLIYIQDDDCLVDVLALYRHYDGRLTNFITPEHFDSYKDTGITLVGWGCFFPKSMIDFGPYLDVFGVNPLFLSQTDRVFTYLNQPHNSVVADVNHLPSATAPDRMSTQSDHWRNLAEIQKQLNCLNIKNRV